MHDDASFLEWTRRWMDLAAFTGPQLQDAQQRIRGVAALFAEPIPGSWQRHDDPNLIDPVRRYRRTHTAADPSPEHALEQDMLSVDKQHAPLRCLGALVIDAINAVSLVRDAHGGRAANVEADMLLLLDTAPRRQVLIEAKASANNAWYATVELLRQMRLFADSPAAQRILHLRAGTPEPWPSLQLTGLVVAPPAFYTANGQKRNAVQPAQRLLARLAADGVDARLATWETTTRCIQQLA